AALAGRRPPGRVLMSLGDSWFAIGPVVVLMVAHAGNPDGHDWAIYLAALAAQFAVDFAASSLRDVLNGGASLRGQIRESSWVYLVDALLAPIGLAVAFAAVGRPWIVLLTLPLTALMVVFARERRARMDYVLELGRAYRGTALVLGNVVEADDAYTGVHCEGVVALAVEVAEAMSLDATARRNVEFGALLHDVGKIAVPKAIVNKAGPLTDEEWMVMRQHTIAGQRMLDKIGGGMTEVGEIVRASHERWDGAGYPDGRLGEDVPLPARIVSVADAFSAITTTRPYRRAQSPEAAVKELRQCAGTQFDPEVVEALVAVLNRPAPATPEEFFARTAYPEPPALKIVPDIDKILEEQLERALSAEDRPGRG
ncbi:MAG TPA: HD-GYP domain-containing protein, partial [Solirubrobacteraceae bacterium]|nr:HD-GYP domain-containing protein [Solirubrobacteraceae bacterium]